MHRSLSLNQKEQEKLWSVIKMTKIQPCVLTLTYFFSYIRHALSFCFRITTGKYRWTETHLDLHLRTQDYVQSSSSFLYSDLSSDLKLVPHILLINLTGGKKTQHMHKDLKDLDRSERSETKMAALGRDDERLDPSTRVLTVLARISERGCQTLFIRSITTKVEMTCIHWTAEN